MLALCRVEEISGESSAVWLVLPAACTLDLKVDARDILWEKIITMYNFTNPIPGSSPFLSSENPHLGPSWSRSRHKSESRCWSSSPVFSSVLKFLIISHPFLSLPSQVPQLTRGAGNLTTPYLAPWFARPGRQNNCLCNNSSPGRFPLGNENGNFTLVSSIWSKIQ